MFLARDAARDALRTENGSIELLDGNEIPSASIAIRTENMFRVRTRRAGPDAAVCVFYKLFAMMFLSFSSGEPGYR